MIRYRIHAEINWIIGHDSQDGLWIAVCDSLNLNADGTTREELDSCMEESVRLLFTDLYESGEFDQFLRNQGWTATREVGAPGPEPTFAVPLQIEERDLEELVHA